MAVTSIAPVADPTLDAGELARMDAYWRAANYVHLNRAIRQRDLDVIYITGPGHGGPGLVANTYLEGTYSEIYPDVSGDADGMRRLFKQFSFPGGVPSHHVDR
jgi:phosphoketolase